MGTVLHHLKCDSSENWKNGQDRKGVKQSGLKKLKSCYKLTEAVDIFF